MKYVSIDIETSGIDPEKHQILEFSAIVEDTENQLDFDSIPKFNRKFYYKEIVGEPVALAMNARLFEIFSTYSLEETSKNEYVNKNNIVDTSFIDSMSQCWHDFNYFLFTNGITKATIAGKNFSVFDLKFLEKTSLWWNKDYQNCFFEKGIIDVSNLYIDFKNDNKLPSTSECLKRAGFNSETHHDSMIDAWNVIQLLRKKY